MTASSNPLCFGINLTGSDRPYAELLATAQLAEELGFNTVALTDRPPENNYEAWTLAPAVGALTHRIRLTHNTLNAPLRNAALLAKMAASLDVIAGTDRVSLTLGAGTGGPHFTSYGAPWGATPGERVTDLQDYIPLTSPLSVDARPPSSSGGKRERERGVGAAQTVSAHVAQRAGARAHLRGANLLPLSPPVRGPGCRLQSKAEVGQDAPEHGRRERAIALDEQVREPVGVDRADAVKGECRSRGPLMQGILDASDILAGGMQDDVRWLRFLPADPRDVQVVDREKFEGAANQRVDGTVPRGSDEQGSGHTSVRGHQVIGNLCSAWCPEPEWPESMEPLDECEDEAWLETARQARPVNQA
jgi:hypothetical protein